MFQTFDVATQPDQGPPRLAALRQALVRAGLDGFLVPRADAHQGEYVAPHDARLSWLTGFTGSAGFCAVLMDQAGVFVDGRYRVQVKDQVDLAHFTPVNWPEVKLGTWLKSALPKGGNVGFDPWLHTAGELETLEKLLAGSGVKMIAAANLVDEIWQDQPAPPAGKISTYPIENAGESAESKVQRLAQALRDAGQSAAVITLPDSIAWLLNIRGADIERNPVPHAFAILHRNATVELFTDPAKAADIAGALGDAVSLHAAGLFKAKLKSLSGTVVVDKTSAPLAVSDILGAANVDIGYGDDPCRLPKAIKNATEIAGTAEAHLRDGAAMVEFLAWLDAQPPGTVSEIDVVTKLEGFRRATNALLDISFETIAGSGANGAIIHYRVTQQTDRTLQAGELIVIDSGAQYIDGTTDITRTVAIGDIGAEERRCFTRVLQGMIAISRARFPKGVAGCHLDALARAPLWMAGQDYDHGTGHGVGVYLCVHEGPQRLSRTSDLPLEPGMILSNEPGYYREGAFGIRIENLIVVEAAKALTGGDDRKMNAFRTLTYVPIDRHLIDVAMLSGDECYWLNAYHAQVHALIAPRVAGDTLNWLTRATSPL